ncbi:hypothetical protein BWQ96_10132 [Gracilariopsis chorda]|uniref:Uncharacterized protein n=1 Tax=Gracilariopsis chorda TaxID=448386 RepID=A0A2V3IDL6_9FLOR|nr:hypothetical protein BWQ96_10132 [Gracilariopsis chorda]|eukprot:PXF40164.1 hypothetical protein BWQ96_10132 [Gracilariopsis chorda]
MAYKAMRRSVMEPIHDAKLREQAEKVYKAIGMDLPGERSKEQKMPPRSHGGFELVSTFVPTPDAPKLNVVHGPLAYKDDKMTLKKEVVGFPIPCAGAEARMRAEIPAARRRTMDVDDEEYEDVTERPYFYPRRERQGVGIRKKRRERKQRVKKRSKPMTGSAMQVEVAT